jgi:hypothetical protein
MTVLDDRATALLATGGVRIIRCSETLISARCRDASGITDVQLTLDGGNARADCTCRPASAEVADCAHVRAVLRITLAPLLPEEPAKPAPATNSPPGWPRTYDFRPHVDAHGIIEAPTQGLWLGFEQDWQRVLELKEARGAAAPQESAELVYAAVSGLCAGHPSLEEISALPFGVACEFAGQMMGAATALHQLPQTAGGGESHFV